MAKRKRLSPPDFGSIDRLAPDAPSGLRPPIADIAGAAAATAALGEVTAELEAARAEGRLVQSLSIDMIDAAYLVRDRLPDAVSGDDMTALVESLRARGQQTPIEVVDTGRAKYGLISGWRRLTALRQLFDETGEARFATVQALIRRPDSAADAYVAMVEENEIRAGLSYYERAQIVHNTVADGVFETEKKALNGLFGSASRARRSKIKSFVPLVRHLGDVLRFPAAIGERLGLKLSSMLEDAATVARLRGALADAAPDSPEAETALLARVAAGADKSKTDKADRAAGEEVAPGIWLRRDASGLRISGKGVTDALVERLRAALKG